MQETKNKRLLISGGILTLLTLVVFWLVRDGKNHLDVDPDIFQVADYKSIDRIELSSDTGVVTLAFNGTRWRVNDRYNADGNMINVLFATLKQARPKRAVGNVQRDSIYRQVAGSGVKVSLFEGPDLRKQFFAGGNAVKTQAFFGNPESKEVYVMAIPGYRVYVSGILEMDESGWRDKFVFGFNWRNFKSLEAEFPQAPAENFIVSLNKGYFGVQGIETDTVRLNTFFDNLFSLTADEYVSRAGLKDSLVNSSPYADFTVTDVGNRTYRLRLFISGNKADALGIIQDSQVAIFSNRKIQPILRRKSFFVKK